MKKLDAKTRKYLLDSAREAVKTICEFGHNPSLEKLQVADDAREIISLVENRLEKSGLRLAWRGDNLVIRPLISLD